MENKQTPLEIEGVSENIYAGFWIRVGSMLLEFLIQLPVVFLIMYLNSLSKNVYFYTFIPNFLILLLYHIYIPKKYGGTPGKLVVGLRILKIDGNYIGWKEAFLRHSVYLLLSLVSSIWMFFNILQADDKIYMNLNWLDQGKYLMSLSPDFNKFNIWASNTWIYSEFIVLLLNKRKRAIHDFIAGTVIVKAKYVNQIREVMSLDVVNNENYTLPNANTI